MLFWTAILGCEPTTTTPPATPTGDTGCTPVVGWTDVDGDGHGDPAARVEGCALPADAVAAGDDCDDGDPDVHPGAIEVCDGRDDDCSGAPEAGETDTDGDGVRACAGDCDDDDPDIHPGATEICDGDDEDCDGQIDLDDPGVDPYSCGYCPDSSTAATVTFETRTVNPCVLDPSISLCSEFPLLFPDTHEQGNRLHRLIWRNDGHPLRDRLLLFLPPGPGTHNNNVLSWAAFAGYRTISLGWQNEPLVENCATSECFDEVRWEMLYGEDTTGYFQITPQDSVMGRLDTLMAYLVSEYPTEGWDAYWDPVQGMHWEDVVLMGWSVGTGEAGYLGLYHPTHAEILVSGPIDVVAGTVVPADWMSEPRAYDACWQWGFYHREEPGAINPDGIPDLFPITLGMLGIPGPPVDVDSVPAPYGEARMLNTDKTAYTESWCNPHQAMAMDECMHPDLSTPYVYMYCAAGNPFACP